MLVEVKKTRQIQGEGFRRWFTDDALDLIVWYDDHHQIVGFQLCYDKHQDEHAVTWRRDRGFSHHRVDDGETPGSLSGHPMTPILLGNGVFDKHALAERFRSASRDIEPSLADLVYTRLLGYPAP
jgi:hypothetical protein